MTENTGGAGASTPVSTYTPQVIDHAQNPRNVGHIPDADGQAQVGDPGCGDYAIMSIKVVGGRVAQAKFLVRGCGAAIATCSVATEMASGKAVDEVMALSDQDILDALGGLPPHKVHCSLLAADALHAAVADYRRRQRPDLRDWRSMYGRR